MAKKFAKKFYKSKEWQGIRTSILMRDKYLCQICGAPAEEVHHISKVTPENIDKAETHISKNLMSLCRDCHCRQHDRDRFKENDSAGDEYYFDNEGNLQKR